MEHLLHLMRRHATGTRYLIKHHPCLVPHGNRTIYTTRLVERVWRLFLTNRPPASTTWSATWRTLTTGTSASGETSS
ncbi:hypothetical protein PR202_gb23358 [Eleusine coracana subsp. coracana]|uniref:Uncharacterized protein n=1 Tax=Eleusine coracana subsp. coracana TaxID=191504 RepID=A0AAV5FFZ1_ELECO|nr:hypothetical protein PR202_gb23358 [Eleusine coracana subsp. coracana]